MATSHKMGELKFLAELAGYQSAQTEIGTRTVEMWYAVSWDFLEWNVLQRLHSMKAYAK